MGLHKLTLTAEIADIRFGTHTEVLVFVNEQTELIGEVGEIFIVRGCSEKKYIAVLSVNQLLDVTVSASLGSVTQIMTFIYDYEPIVTRVIYLTQQELSDLSHVSVKQIANIEKGKMNPSYLILRALAKVLHISLDTLINPDISLEDEGVNQMKMLYSSCPPEMRDTLLHHTQETVKELTELSEKFEMN